MAANTTPIFTLTPVIGMAVISTANTNRDGTGDIATVITGATDGTRIHKITVIATVTTTAGMVRLYIADATPNIRLWREVQVSAITVGATVKGFTEVISLVGETALILPSGYSIRASTHNAHTFNVIAEGGNY
jgi:hypothetical protein